MSDIKNHLGQLHLERTVPSIIACWQAARGIGDGLQSSPLFSLRRSNFVERRHTIASVLTTSKRRKNFLKTKCDFQKLKPFGFYFCFRSWLRPDKPSAIPPKHNSSFMSTNTVVDMNLRFYVFGGLRVLRMPHVLRIGTKTLRTVSDERSN